MRGISLSFGLIFLFALAATTQAHADAKLDAALCKDVVGGSAASITAILKKGADVNASCDDETPLMNAVSDGNTAAVMALLDAKADVTRRDTEEGWTALYWARSVQVADLLINHGADVNARDKDGATPLSILISTSEVGTISPEVTVAIADYLIAHGADVNAADKDNDTPLMQAALVASIPLV